MTWRTRRTWDWGCLLNGPLQILDGLVETFTLGWGMTPFYLNHCARRLRRQMKRSKRSMIERTTRRRK